MNEVKANQNSNLSQSHREEDVGERVPDMWFEAVFLRCDTKIMRPRRKSIYTGLHQNYRLMCIKEYSNYKGETIIIVRGKI